MIGAGIVGQLTALALLDRGWRGGVLLENAMPPASLAGGGILSPMFPWRYTAELNRLAEPGCRAYARLSERLAAAGCIDGGEFFRSGIWMELLPHEAEALAEWREYTLQHYRLEPRFLNEENREGVYFPELGSIRSTGIMRGLRQYLISRGVRFCHGDAVGWQAGLHGVEVRLQHGSAVHCEILVVAAGAGAKALLPTEIGQFPAKGEMLMYRLGADAPKELILTREGYVIPRSNGDTVVGSTLRRGDDSHYPTVTGRYHLQRLAEMLLPQCRGRKPDAHWAGVRPGLGRDYPYIGRVPGERNVYAAVGHYRNGLVCAPASATLLAQIISGAACDLNPEDYSLPSSRSSSSFLSR